jgi:hypothetical protein
MVLLHWPRPTIIAAEDSLGAASLVEHLGDEREASAAQPFKALRPALCPRNHRKIGPCRTVVFAESDDRFNNLCSLRRLLLAAAQESDFAVGRARPKGMVWFASGCLSAWRSAGRVTQPPLPAPCRMRCFSQRPVAASSSAAGKVLAATISPMATPITRAHHATLYLLVAQFICHDSDA